MSAPDDSFEALKRELVACLADVAEAGMGSPLGMALMAGAIDRALRALAGAQLAPAKPAEPDPT